MREFFLPIVIIVVAVLVGLCDPAPDACRRRGP